VKRWLYGLTLMAALAAPLGLSRGSAQTQEPTPAAASLPQDGEKESTDDYWGLYGTYANYLDARSVADYWASQGYEYYIRNNGNHTWSVFLLYAS
jgi:hypothetical protein